MAKDFGIKTIKPVAVITAYDNGHLAYREVNDKGEVGTSKGLYKKTASKLFKAIYSVEKEYNFKSIIPKHIKYVKNDAGFVMVWIKKASIQNLSFSINKKNYNHNYAVPNLCFKITGTSLSVVAIKSFSLNAKIYYAPFPNISTSGICMGSASLKFDNLDYFEDIVEYAEMQFFNSHFSHGETAYHKKGRNKDSYDNNWLHPIGKDKNPKTIKDFINGKI